MGFYAPAQIVRDLREHGVTILPVDVNHSEWDCTQTSEVLMTSEVYGTPALRLGYRLIRGFPRAAIEKIVAARRDGPFRSLPDFARRTRLSRTLLARLSAADAFGSLGLSRRTALWKVLALQEDLPLFPELDPTDDHPETLPLMSLETHVVADYDSTGLSLKAHPIGLIRGELTRLRALPAAQLADKPDKTTIRVAGLVLVRQRPATAKGTIFITLEDETGVANLVVWPRVWERYRKVARQAVALLCQGRIERAGQVIHVIADKLEDLTDSLRQIAVRSRDFH
jgi:error-prone DNA polymerase